MKNLLLSAGFSYAITAAIADLDNTALPTAPTIGGGTVNIEFAGG